MTFTLYNYVLSGNCYKVRLLASLLNVEYESVTVDFHPGKAHLSEAMLQLNPAGTLPVLVTNSFTLTETQAMLVWLAQQYDSSNTWWPANNDHTAAILQWLGFSSRLTATVGELRLHTMLGKDINEAAAQRGAITTLRELESHLVEQRLREQAWLVGNNTTVADIACFPYVALSPDANIEHDEYPAIRRWVHSVRSLPGFITMPGIFELHEARVSVASKTEGAAP